MKEEAELGRTETRHKKVGMMPGDKAMSETDEVGFRAGDENVGGCESVATIGAHGVIPSARTKTVRVVGMKSMTSDKLKTCGLEIARASNEAPLCEFWEGPGSQ